MRVRLETQFGLIPFVISTIKDNQEELLSEGVLDKLELEEANYTPFEVSDIFYKTPNNWTRVLNDNGIEPFSFYKKGHPIQNIYKPTGNSDLY